VISYASALGWTLAIEVPIYAVGLTSRKRMDAKQALPAAIIVNLLSHTTAFLVVFPVVERAVGSFVGLVVVEAGIVFFEAALLRNVWRIEERLAMLVSVIANCVSLTVGLTLLR
jgi:hypothetical protein